MIQDKMYLLSPVHKTDAMSFLIFKATTRDFPFVLILAPPVDENGSVSTASRPKILFRASQTGAWHHHKGWNDLPDV